MSSQNKKVKGLLLKVDNVVICEVEEIQAELGEPDCKIKNPYQYDKDAGLTPWPDFAGQTEMMLRSDDILTMVEPKQEIIDQYLELTK
jgi:hypothetical protein|tara:strand:+ start:1142 stop:1405 length:264 start_codon:yes stop_codon:yes gene_type:complete